MAFEVRRAPVGVLKAGADLSALQFRFVNVDATGVIAVTVLGQQAVGVLQNKPKSGEAADYEAVGGGGIVRVETDGTVAVGERVTTTANGRAAQAAATQYVYGIALAGDGGSAGALVPVQLVSLGKE